MTTPNLPARPQPTEHCPKCGASGYTLYRGVRSYKCGTWWMNGSYRCHDNCASTPRVQLESWGESPGGEWQAAPDVPRAQGQD